MIFEVPTKKEYGKVEEEVDILGVDLLLGYRRLLGLEWREFILFLYFIHCIIPFGKFGTPYLQKATAAARAALPSPTSAC